MDIFRVFDSLNYMDNLLFGIDTVTAAGGIAEGTLCYTGDLTDPSRDKVRARGVLGGFRVLFWGLRGPTTGDMGGRGPQQRPPPSPTPFSHVPPPHPYTPSVLCHTHNHHTPPLRPVQYKLDYYLSKAEKLVGHGVHSLGIKDMAGESSRAHGLGGFRGV